MLGCENFVRVNPRSDRFGGRAFAHTEFWCGDAQNTARRFSGALGMPMVARCDLSSGDTRCSSYVLRSRDLCLVFTAPSAVELAGGGGTGASLEAVNGSRGATGDGGREDGVGLPGFDAAAAHRFVQRHGLAVRAVALEVDDTAEAYCASVKHGARPALAPCRRGGGMRRSP